MDSIAQPVHASDGPMRVRRARSFPWPTRLFLVSFLWLLSTLAFVAFAGLTTAMVVNDDRPMGYWALAALGVFALLRLVVFILSPALHCSLCHGTVAQARSCRKHDGATKLPLLSHRASTLLAVFFTGRFCCMYCGTLFRIWR